MINTTEEARAIRATRGCDSYRITCETCGAEIVAYYANREPVCHRCYARNYYLTHKGHLRALNRASAARYDAEHREERLAYFREYGKRRKAAG